MGKYVKTQQKYSKNPYLVLLVARNVPLEDYEFPVQLVIVLPISPNNLTVKLIDSDEFKEWKFGK